MRPNGSGHSAVTMYALQSPPPPHRHPTPLQDSEFEDDEDLNNGAGGRGGSGAGASGSAAAAPKKQGLLASFVSSLAMNVVGKAALSRADVEPALAEMKRKLMERNVAEEIAAQVCAGCGAAGRESQSLLQVVGVLVWGLVGWCERGAGWGGQWARDGMDGWGHGWKLYESGC